MSKIQTRKTISFECDLYDAITEHCHSINKSRAEYVSELIRNDLTSLGKPVGKQGYHQKRPDPNLLQDSELIKAAKAQTENLDPKKDPKYLAALEYTRKQMMKNKPITPKKRRCMWCDGYFAKGENLVDYRGDVVHAKCLDAIRRSEDV